MSMAVWQWTLIAALVLAMLELTTGAFVFLGLALGAAAVAALQWLTDGSNLTRDLLLFALVSLVAVAVLRRLFRQPRDTVASTPSEDVNRY